MPIPVWLPFALKGGSMVASGIGNYLEGKNQESYSKRVMRMQQEASSRRQKAEGAAGAANIWFGLAGRQQMKPMYQEEPDIDPYESSGAGTLWRGLGTGLGYASTALGAYDSASQVLTARAEAAGAKAGAARFMEAVGDSSSAVIDQVPGTEVASRFGDAVINPGISTVDNAVQHHREVLSHLLDDTKATNIANYGGIFGNTQNEAYDTAYRASLGATVEKENTKLAQAIERVTSRARQTKMDEANLAHMRDTKEYRNMVFEADQEEKRLLREFNKKVDTQEKLDKVFGFREGIGTNINTAIIDSELPAKVQKQNELIAMFKDLPGLSFVSNEQTGLMEAKIDLAYDAKAPLTSGKMYRFLQLWFRAGSDEAIHESDFINLNKISTGIVGEGKIAWHNFFTDNSVTLEGIDVPLDEILTDRKMFENGTVQNMFNTVLQNNQHTTKELQGLIGRHVAYEASNYKWAGGMEMLGFTDQEQFTNYYTEKFDNLYNVTDIFKPTQGTKGEALNKINATLNTSTWPSAARAMESFTGRPYTSTMSDAYLYAYGEPVLRTPQISDAVTLATAEDFLITGQSRSGREAFTSSSGREATNWLAQNKKTLLNYKDGVDRMQQSVLDSNYAWGNNRLPSDIGLAAESSAGDYLPSSRTNPNTAAGKAGVLNFFGLGGLYTDTAPALTSIGSGFTPNTYDQKRPWLGNPTLDAAKQFQRGRPSLRSVYTTGRR